MLAVSAGGETLSYRLVVVAEGQAFQVAKGLGAVATIVPIVTASGGRVENAVGFMGVDTDAVGTEVNSGSEIRSSRNDDGAHDGGAAVVLLGTRHRNAYKAAKVRDFEERWKQRN